MVANINVMLPLGLIYLYALILIWTRAHCTAGLLIFAVLLLLQNVVTAYGHAEMSASIGSGFD